MSFSSSLRCAAGSYEGSIFGWNLLHNSEGASALEMSWGFHCCVGSLKALAISSSGKYLVCGGMDERIRIFDMQSNKAVGELSNHSGAVTCLQFFGDTHLISGSEDSTLCIWRVEDWVCVHILGGHKEGVHDVSIHPSGKCALSVSKDQTMRLWNLVEGRCSYTRKLHSVADKVQWSTDGTRYLLNYSESVGVHDAATNQCTATVTRNVESSQSSTAINKRVNKAMFVNEDGVSNAVLILYESKHIGLVSSTGEEIATMDLSSLGGRPRDMFVSTNNVDGSNECIATVISSVGQVSILSVRDMMRNAASVEEITLASHQLRAEPRLMCVVTWPVVPSQGTDIAWKSPVTASNGKKVRKQNRKKHREQVEAVATSNREAVDQKVDRSLVDKLEKKKAKKQLKKAAKAAAAAVSGATDSTPVTPLRNSTPTPSTEQKKRKVSFAEDDEVKEIPSYKRKSSGSKKGKVRR